MIRIAALLAIISVTHAFAEDGGCVPIETATKMMPSLPDAKPLSRDQFWFAAGVFYALPDTPQAFPHGDHAVLVEDGLPTVVFFDGAFACERMRLSKPSAQALEDVGAAKFNRAGEDN